MIQKFDPTDYNFTPDTSLENLWRTFPDSDWELTGTYVGCYVINKLGSQWTIREVLLKNDRESYSTLYMGKIPNKEFGHQLLLNLELDVPVIQRELKINFII